MHRSVRLVLAGVAGVGCLLLGASGAWAADTPAFAFSHAVVDRHHGSLVVPYRVTGLAPTATTEKVTLTVTGATADYQCFGVSGGKPAPGAKATATAGPITKDATFPVRKGVSGGWAWVAPPAAPASLTCAPGEKLFLTSEKYSGLSLSGASGESTAVKPDPASGGPAPIHVKPSS